MEMQVFALGEPQGNTGEKVKKPVSRKFIVLSSLEILFFCWQPIAYTFIINIYIYMFKYFLYINFCGIYVSENTPVYMSWLRMY